MKILLSVTAAVLTGGTAAQAQHGHGGHSGGHTFSHVVAHSVGHAYSHGGHTVGYGHGVGYGYLYGGHSGVHLHGYTPVYNSYPTYSYPMVVAAPIVWPATTIAPALGVQAVGEVAPTPVAGVVTPTSLKPNAIPPYAGHGVTLRLPAEYPGSVYVQVDKREVEIKPGTEVVFKDKYAYRVEFDKGGDFGASSGDITEGVYKFKVAEKGWFLVPDAPTDGGLRRNSLPGEPKK